jgi:hypothetical protein
MRNNFMTEIGKQSFSGKNSAQQRFAEFIGIFTQTLN